MTSPAKSRGVRLRSPENIRSELARVYRALSAGTIDPEKARVSVYILQTLAAVIRDVGGSGE